MIRALIGFLVIGSCGILQAAPLLYFTLEGRKQGSMDAFASSVDVALGDVIEYRLQMNMAPSGTPNANLNSGRSHGDKHGVNSLSIAMLQDPAESIQVDFNAPAELAGDSRPLAADGWHRGVGDGGGVVSPRGDSNWNDLWDIRPVRGPGVFASSQDETVLTGLFTVANVAGESAEVRPEWGSYSGYGALDGYGFLLTTWRHLPGSYRRPSEIGSDPIAHFTPLTLTAAGLETVPEPSTMALIGRALLGLALFRRKANRAAVNRPSTN